MLRKLAVCALLALSAASAASYKVTLLRPSTVNGAKLQPGQYRLDVENNKISFVKSKQTTAEASVKVETGEATFRDTSIMYRGAESIAEICIKGTKTKLILE